MKLLVLCNQAPYPPHHGGLADVWRRLCAMREAGIECFLVFWAGDVARERPTPVDWAAMRGVCAQVHCCWIRQSVAQRARRLTRLATHHSHVVSRMLGRREIEALHRQAAAFGADAVWLESIHAAGAARALARALERPLYVRSANIEHVYAQAQSALAARRVDRWRWGHNVARLRRLEFETLRAARGFFDISADDLAWWQAQGLTNGHWLPPLIDSALAERLQPPWQVGECRFDVGYLGNLFAPNNVDGLLWYLREVVPQLRRARPALRVFVAGSNPAAAVVQAAAQCGVELIANPPDAAAVLRSARVLVNPVFAGSGVNIKAIDMLFSPAALVATPQGVAGLPRQVQSVFAVASAAEDFARAVLQGLDTASGPSEASVGVADRGASFPGTSSLGTSTSGTSSAERRAARAVFSAAGMRTLRGWLESDAAAAAGTRASVPASMASA